MTTLLRREAPCLILLGCMVLHSGCRESNTFVPPPPPDVTVASPVRDQVVVYFEFTGRTAPFESVELRARVSGILEKILFEEGTVVSAGAPLYEIERVPYEAALQAAKADVARTAAMIANAEFELNKVKDLHSRGVSTEQELVIAQAKYDEAVAARMAAEAKVTQAELNLAYTHIEAPISGRINQSRVDEGNLVGLAEPTLLTTIVPWNPMHVYFSVSERDVLRLRRKAAEQGESARADRDAYLRLADGTDYPLAGHIDYVDNQVDPATGTIRVRAVFENPDDVLIPGIFTRVRIPGAPREALLVPEVALQRDMAGHFLLVVGNEGLVERRNVQVAELVGDARVITAGLEDGATVIINGLQRARPGIKVNARSTIFVPDKSGMPGLPTSPSPPTTAPSTDESAEPGDM